MRPQHICYLLAVTTLLTLSSLGCRKEEPILNLPGVLVRKGNLTYFVDGADSTVALRKLGIAKGLDRFNYQRSSEVVTTVFDITFDTLISQTGDRRIIGDFAFNRKKSTPTKISFGSGMPSITVPSARNILESDQYYSEFARLFKNPFDIIRNDSTVLMLQRIDNDHTYKLILQ